MALPKIRELYFTLTHKCNLECKYCFVSQNENTMSCETAFAGVDFLAKNLVGDQTATVNFFGGEPLLRWSQVIVPTVLYGEKMYPGKIRFNITSNCILLDDEKSKFIINHKMGLLTSFDGCKSTQDYNRPFHNGDGSYDIAYKNIMAHKANGAKLNQMRATVYPDTAHWMYENYLQAIDMGYTSIFFMADSFSTFTKEQEEGYKEALYKIAEHYINYYNEHNNYPIVISNFERDFPQAMEDVIRAENGLDIPTKPHTQICGYGQTYGAALSPTGDFYSCQQMTSNETGSESMWWIGDLATGIHDDRRVALLNAFNAENGRKGDMPCSECSGRSICRGGCSATNFLIYSQMRQNSPTWCLDKRIHHEVEMYIASNLRNNKAFNQRLENLKTRFKSVCAVCQENQQVQ